MGRITKKLHSLFGSNRFFWLIFGIFIFEASWIALSAIYPQAFDENFHFGLIKTYSHYWFPYLSKQPVGGDVYGAVARDPSFLYHYLMGFIYRLVNLFVHGQVGQVIIFRFIDIGLFASSLPIFKKVLNRVGLSNQLANIILFLFILIPVVPQLAGQVNYDDLLMPLVAISALLSFNVIDQVKAKKLEVRSIVWLFLVCLIAILVKIEFAPIFLGIISYLIYLVYKNYKQSRSKFMQQLGSGWNKQSMVWRVFVIVLFLFLGSMFIQRDAVNVIEYHSVDPGCSQILTVQQCNSYSVWNADNGRHQLIVDSKTKTSFMGPVHYLGSWAYWMWYRLFFAVNGPNNFTNYPPLPLPIAASIIIFVYFVYSILRYRRSILKHNSYLVFLGWICLLYVAILIYQGYSAYRYTDTLELMNGRYLLPILIFIGAIAGSAFSLSLKSSVAKKLIVAVLVLIMFLEGGGLLTFIDRSDNTWYWDNGAVVKVNHAAKKLTSKLVVKGQETYTTKDWFFN
jgi:hypothetical protein